ncbi:MAG: enoyl-CoA hydratase/isomerase family protein [Candidatus Competibacteraceae bacterium]|nr:enoyl-CoA hydratase/isomerase family protein [Candidatus Competibacteraceae bacterium]
MSYRNIISDKKDGICLITINRPDKLNALNKETIAEISACVSQCGADSAIRAMIITGSGEKAFVAGADISEFAHFNKEEGRDLSAEGQAKLFDLIEQTTKPVIAAINGFALGGGLELALACHIRYCSDNARMGLPEVSLGVIPGYGGTQRLPLLIGRGRAMELIVTAGMISAQDALLYGLVNKVTPQSELLGACMELAGKIIKNSPSAIRQAIQAVNAGYAHQKSGFESEINGFGNCFDSEDFKEGTSAFMEKRKPVFTGK